MADADPRLHEGGSHFGDGAHEREAALHFLERPALVCRDLLEVALERRRQAVDRLRFLRGADRFALVVFDEGHRQGFDGVDGADHRRQFVVVPENLAGGTPAALSRDDHVLAVLVGTDRDRLDHASGADGLAKRGHFLLAESLAGLVVFRGIGNDVANPDHGDLLGLHGVSW